MPTTPDQDKKRLRQLLRDLTYPAGYYKGGKAARRVSLRVMRDVAQAVYVTPDRVDQVEHWFYNEALKLGPRSHSVGVSSGTEGRYAYFRDHVRYRTERAFDKGPMSVRQLIAPYAGIQAVVLIHRRPDVPLTQIAITLLTKPD